MNNHQIRSLTAGVVAALVITALLLLVEKTSLVLAGYFFSLLGIIEFFGTIYYAAGSSKNSWLTNAAFPLAVKNYGIATVLFSVAVFPHLVYAYRMVHFYPDHFHRVPDLAFACNAFRSGRDRTGGRECPDKYVFMDCSESRSRINSAPDRCIIAETCFRSL